MRWARLVSITCLLAVTLAAQGAYFQNHPWTQDVTIRVWHGPARAAFFTTRWDTSIAPGKDPGIRKLMLEAMLWLTGQDR
jgi:hypothetical protein